MALVALPPGTAPASFAGLADGLGDPEATYLGHYTSQPKLLTTTPNPANDLFVGVHVDNFDRLPYATRYLGRRRLCFNLGPGTRHLLLCTVDIRTVTKAVHHDHERRHPHTDDLRAYLAAGRTINILRIRLAPARATSPPPNYSRTTAPPSTPWSRPPPRSGSATGPQAACHGWPEPAAPTPAVTPKPRRVVSDEPYGW